MDSAHSESAVDQLIASRISLLDLEELSLNEDVNPPLIPEIGSFESPFTHSV